MCYDEIPCCFQICRGNKYSKNFNYFGACHIAFHIFLQIVADLLTLLFAFQSFALALCSTTFMARDVWEFSLDLVVPQSHTHMNASKKKKEIRHSLAILYLESKLNTHNQI